VADRLFNRDVVINVGGLRIASRLLDSSRQQLGLKENEVSTILRVVFKVTRTLKKEPNKAEVRIYNLKKDNRIALQERNQPTIIEAGYIDNVSQIFNGDLEFGRNERDGRNWITTLQAADGSRKYKTARVSLSLKGPAAVGDVLQAAADALGINPGNLSEAISNGSARGALTEFTNGIVLSGKAEQQLDKVAKSMGLKWSIQDGQLQFLRPGQYVGTQAALLTPSTGLVGSPEPGDKGFVEARCLMQPNLAPGSRVQIQSAEVDGFYLVTKSVYTGDTHGGDWYVDIEGKPL